MEYDRVDNFKIKMEYDRQMRIKFEGHGWISNLRCTSLTGMGGVKHV